MSIRDKELAAFEKFPPYQSGSDTSRMAAEDIKEHAPRLRTAVFVYINEHGPVTDEEVSDGLNMVRSSAIARRNELVSAGLVQDSGERKMSEHGSLATMWEVSDEN